MAKLQPRERNLGIIVILVVTTLFGQRISRKHKDEILGLQGQIFSARQRVQASRALLASAPKPTSVERRPAMLNDTTMRMLKDVTVPVEIRDIKVVSVDHPSEAEFKMVLEGRFGGLMKFLSYLERPDGDFRVNHVDIARVHPDAPANADESEVGARSLRSTIQLTRRS